ncbi:zonadhesin-like, partial [Silurus meridionalis]
QDKGASSYMACSLCPPGMYCPARGSIQPSGFCSPGHYCTGGADSAKPNAKAVQLACFCNLLPESSRREYRLCAQRHNTACTSNSKDLVLSELNSESAPEDTQAVCSDFTGDICPIGFYCPVGSFLPQLCNAGSHCNQTSLHEPVGFCPAGFYCPKGSSDPYATTCPPGHYCPRGTDLPLPCLPGTFRDSAGGVSIEDCL